MDWVTSIHQALQYIEEHLREELTIREIAQQAALSPFYFQKGFAMLCGMTVGDYIRQRRERGESREEAILRACPLRVRPVMMTTLTTILAMVPMALGLGDSNEMMSDMGVTMMSGMIISTVVTLLFTPVYYSVIDNLSHVFRKNKRKSEKQLIES